MEINFNKDEHSESRDINVEGTQLINRIKSDENCIDEVYNEYKRSFIKWVIFNYPIDEAAALDIFQDTIIGFYKNIVSGKLNEMRYSVKTYLFSIGKNLIMNKLRYDKRFENSLESFDLIVSPEPVSFADISDETKLFIDRKIKELGEPCYSLLKLFYYNGYSLEAIAREIKSKNQNVVKAQKSRCLTALRNLFQLRYQQSNFYR